MDWYTDNDMAITEAFNEWKADVEVGDSEFSTAVFDEFFWLVAHNTLLQNNPEFRALFSELCGMALDWLEEQDVDIDVLEPFYGIDAWRLENLNKKMNLTQLKCLADELATYEYEQTVMETCEEIDWHQSDFIDFDESNLIL